MQPAPRAELRARNGFQFQPGLPRHLLQPRREELLLRHFAVAPFRQSKDRSHDPRQEHGHTDRAKTQHAMQIYTQRGERSRRTKFFAPCNGYGDMAYHEGELEMQRRAGVRALADRVGGIINAEIPRAAAAFVAAQHFLIVATVDADGAPTASILGGAPGFTSARNERSLAIVPSFGHLARVM